MRRLCGTEDDVEAVLHYLAGSWTDTTSQAGHMVLTVFVGLAEFERAMIHHCTNAVRIGAKARRVRFVRRPELTADQITLGEPLVGEDVRTLRGQAAQMWLPVVRHDQCTRSRHNHRTPWRILPQRWVINCGAGACSSVLTRT